jgi:hypothetical protein
MPDFYTPICLFRGKRSETSSPASGFAARGKKAGTKPRCPFYFWLIAQGPGPAAAK